MPRPPYLPAPLHVELHSEILLALSALEGGGRAEHQGLTRVTKSTHGKWENKRAGKHEF